MTNQELIGEVKKFNKGSRYIGRFLEHYQTELFVEIVKRTQFLSKSTFTQRLYCIENNITEIPKCQLPGCDNPVGWNGHKFCSHCCTAHSSLDPNVQQKTRNTNLERNGSETYNNQSKAKQTKQEIYGNENYNNREQYLTTCNKRYGVNNPMQLDEIKNKVKATMLETQGVEWAMQSQAVQEKSRKTCNDRYDCDYVTQTDWFKEHSKKVWLKNLGVDNPSKSDEVKTKIQETMREHHGVDWAMQSQTIRNKAKETFHTQYGVDNPMQVPEIKHRMFQTLVNKHPNGYTMSKPEIELGNYVATLCNCEIEFNCRTILKDDRELDIYIPSKKLAIEFNGDYWHMNPKHYAESYYNTQAHCTAKQKWEYDRQKQEECQQLGIKLIVVWEHDWMQNQDQVKNMIQKELEVLD